MHQVLQSVAKKLGQTIANCYIPNYSIEKLQAIAKKLGQTIANCYITNYSIKKMQAIAKFSVKLSQCVHCKIFAQTREKSYIVNYSINYHKRLPYLRSNYRNPCIAHYFVNFRKLLQNLLSNYRIAHRTPQTTALIDYVIETGCG